ncbi:MAG: transposase [Bacteroidota bacterium]
MKSSRFSKSQRLAILAQHDSGESIESICRAHQISPATFYNWKKDLKEDQDENKRRLKQLEQENARLKKMYAELMIDHEILKEGYAVAKKISAQSKKKH